MDHQGAEDRIKQLEARLAELEAKAGSQTVPRQTETMTAPPPPPGHRPAPPAPHRPATSRPSSGGFEQWVGKHGLSFVGVALLVLGVGFFLVYTLQYLAPLGKDLLGLAVAIILFILSRSVESKSLRFGQIIFGGSVAIAYFTAYAMYYFPAAQVITDQFAALLLLLAVSVCVSIYTLLHYKTEFPTLLSIALLYLTMNIGEFSTFTFPALLVVTLAAVALAWRKGWETTLFVTMILAYLTYLTWGYGLHTPEGRPLAPSEQLSYDFFFLTVYYLVFLAPTFTLRQTAMIPVITLVNSGFFVLSLGASISTLYFEHGWGILLFVFAVLNGLWVAVARASRASLAGTTATTLMCISLIGAIPLYLTGSVIAWGWLLASLAFLVLGYGLQSRVYAWFGLVAFWLTGLRYLFVDGPSNTYLGTTLIPERLVLGLVFIVVAFLLAQYRQPRLTFLKDVERIFSMSFNLFAMAAIAILFQFQFAAGFVSLGWGLASVAALVTGVALKDRSLRLSAMILLGVMVLRIIFFDLVGLEIIYRIVSFIIIGAVLLGASWIYHRYMADKAEDEPGV